MIGNFIYFLDYLFFEKKFKLLRKRYLSFPVFIHRFCRYRFYRSNDEQ